MAPPYLLQTLLDASLNSPQAPWFFFIMQYSETSEQRTHWGQDSCLLWRGCPYLGGGHTPNLELVNKFNAEGCGLQDAESANLDQAYSEQAKIDKTKEWTDSLSNKCWKLILFLWFVLVVLVSICSWRLFCTECCPLGARWLSVVRSREVSACSNSNTLIIGGGRKFSLGGLSVNIVREARAKIFNHTSWNEVRRFMHVHDGGIAVYS